MKSEPISALATTPPDPARRLIRRANGTTLLVYTFTDRSDECQEQWMNECTEQMLSMTGPFAVIHDMRQLTSMSARQRAAYAACRARLKDVYEAYKALSVYVVRERRQEGFLIAVGWIQQPTATSGRRFSASLEEAERICCIALDVQAQT